MKPAPVSSLPRPATSLERAVLADVRAVLEWKDARAEREFRDRVRLLLQQMERERLPNGARDVPTAGFLETMMGCARQVADLQDLQTQDWYQFQVMAASREAKRRIRHARSLTPTNIVRAPVVDLADYLRAKGKE